jgi:leucyl aminopeptidase
LTGRADTTVTFSGTTVRPGEVDVDLLFVPVFQDGQGLSGQDLQGLDEATGGEAGRALARGEFRPKAYELFLTPVSGAGWRPRRVALIGAGRPDEWSAERLKRVAAAGSYAARRARVTSVGWLLRGPAATALGAQIAADGLSASEFDGRVYKHNDDPPGPYPLRWVVVAPAMDQAALDAAVARGRLIGQAVNMARGLATEPGNVLTPTTFAARVAEASTAAGLTVDVLDEARIRELKMGLLLGVAQGSAEPPRLIVIRHDPPGAPPAPVLGFVGKGVTFDSGGISLKPAEKMDRMKDDMSGGAAVASALQALARLGCPHRVIGVIPMTENMPGGRATRPGDVLTGASGKTVEIVNTDAEGRLILGDALWYARQLGATHLVDVATLTGACVVALGYAMSGLFGGPDDWVGAVAGAAARAGERVWPMPIYEEAREQMRSDIADLVNSGGRPGGAVTAAAFLREFSGDGPWAHLDIAGTAWAETSEAYQPKGATGVAVRLLIELATKGGARGGAGSA